VRASEFLLLNPMQIWRVLRGGFVPLVTVSTQYLLAKLAFTPVSELVFCAPIDARS
jgi:hypothetical protein